jgi:hypothetical protein
MYTNLDILAVVSTTLFFLLTFFVSLKSKSYKDASTFMIVMFFLHCFFIAATFIFEQTTFRLAYTIYAFLYFITLAVTKLSFVKRNSITAN